MQAVLVTGTVGYGTSVPGVIRAGARGGRRAGGGQGSIRGKQSLRDIRASATVAHPRPRSVRPCYVTLFTPTSVECDGHCSRGTLAPPLTIRAHVMSLTVNTSNRRDADATFDHPTGDT